MSSLVEISKDKSMVAQFTARRASPDLRFKNEVGFAMAQVQNNEKLQRCDPNSVGNAIIEAGAVGLSLHPRLGHAYLIPYGNQCQLSIGYQGMTHLVARAGTLKSVQANVVCENDPEFNDWTDRTGRNIMHRTARKNRGKVTHAYCIAHFSNGGYHIEVMDAEELAACERAASSRNKAGGAVWRSAFRSEMCKKAVIRRAWKHWPKDDGGVIAAAMEAMDKFEPVDFDREVELTVTEDDVNEMHAKLTDAGLEAVTADKWLQRIADISGLGSIRDLPASAKDKVLSDLDGYLAARNKGGI